MSADQEAALSGRSAALDAVIRVAIAKAEKDSHYWSRFDVDDVHQEIECADPSNRTIRRAVSDARALGWVERRDNQKRMKPGPQAEEIVDRE